MHKRFLVDLKDFKQLSKVNYDNYFPTFVVKEEKTRSFYTASQISTHIDQFDKKIFNGLFDRINKIVELFPTLFIKFRGFSETGFSKELYPIFITGYTANGKLSQIIQNEKNDDIPFDWDDTKKLINIYGIAFAFYKLNKYQMINFDILLENIYETKKFYPKINLYYFTNFKNLDLSKNQPNTSFSNYCYQYATIIYSIITGEQVKLSFLKDSYKNDHFEFKKSISERYKKLILECISKNQQDPPISFERILYQLKNDKDFITEKVNQTQFYEYIQFLKTFSKDTSIEDEENPYSIDISSFDLSKFTKEYPIYFGFHDFVYCIKNKENGCFFSAKMIKLEIDNNLTSNNNNPIIVTEYIKNGSLEELLTIERDKLENISFWNDTLKLINIYGIASAMSYLHSNNIIHRDLKPDNILLDDFIFPKLIDFGNSKFLSNFDDENDYLEKKSNSIGSYRYMAPEIFKENKCSKFSDVYSFGMTVYEILANKIPFCELKLEQVIYFVSYRNIRPDFKNVKISKIFKKLIKSCWDENPQKRPPFDVIVKMLENNPEFITENVDKSYFQSYVQYIKQKQEDTNETIVVDKSKIFKKISFGSRNTKYFLDESVNLSSIDNFD